MPQPAAPTHPSSRSARSGLRGVTTEPMLAGLIDVLVWKADGLIRQIDAVWDDTPETIALLAEWSDSLEAQRRELIAMRSDMTAVRTRQMPMATIGREVASHVSLALSAVGRLARIEALGHRFLHLLAEAAAATDDTARRGALDCLRARAARHVSRLADWTRSAH